MALGRLFGVDDERISTRMVGGSLMYPAHSHEYKYVYQRADDTMGRGMSDVDSK